MIVDSIELIYVDIFTFNKVDNLKKLETSSHSGSN